MKVHLTHDLVGQGLAMVYAYDETPDRELLDLQRAAQAQGASATTRPGATSPRRRPRSGWGCVLLALDTAGSLEIVARLAA